MKKLIFIGCLPLTMVLVLFLSTDASKVPSPVLILPFIMLFIGISGMTAILLHLQGVSRSRSWRVGLVIAAVPLILLILQSIGQLTVRDLLTIAVLLAVSYFYVSRSTAVPS